MNGAPLRFKFAVNPAGKDKTWDFELLATRYEDVEGTIQDVKRHVGDGHALCAGLLGGHRRSKANVLGSHWILLDIDNTDVLKDSLGQPVKDENGKDTKIYKPELTLEAALANEFIQKHCALIYTTASHRPDWHKFRLVFLLPEYVEGADTVEACTRFLMQHLPHDPACKDASRVFYGNSKAEFPLVQPNATLPLDWVMQARETAQRERVEHAEQVRLFEERKREIRARANEEGWDTDALIQQALSYIPPRSPGSGNYQECLQVLMALYAYYGAEAEVLAESWSPSIKGTTWNIGHKIRSFRGGRTNGITVGTLFHLAKQYGFKFPSPERQQRWDEPDAQAYNQYLKQEAEQEQFEAGLDRYQNGRALEKILGKTLKRIKKLVSQTPKYLGVSGFQEVAPVQPNAEGIIQFKKGDREKTVSQIALNAQKEGRRAIILDNTEMGQGKSHGWGEMSNAVLGVDKLFYTSLTHRNPSTSTIESNFIDLPVRNSGLLSDDTKQTSLGKNHVRWAKKDKGEVPNLTGNCSRTHLFHILGSKGFHSETSASASANPICKTCKFALGCAEAKDKEGRLLMRPVLGNIYRSDRQKALANEKIRCALDSLPDLDLFQQGKKKEGEPPKRVGLVVDEFHQQYRAINLTQLELQEFDTTWGYFESRPAALRQEVKEMQLLLDEKREEVSNLSVEDEQQLLMLTQEILSLAEEIRTTQKLIQRLPSVLETVRPIIHSLRLVLAGELPTNQESYHGWNENLLREEIGTLPEGVAEAIEVLSALNPKLTSLLDGTEADSVSQNGVEGSSKQKKESSGALKYIRSAFDRESRQQARERLKALPTNSVVPILKILTGERGSFRIKHGVLEVVTPNHRHQEQLLAADLTVVLDATLTQEELAENLGIDPSEIVVIEQERESYENLTVVQVGGLGKLTKSRSSELTNRLDALLEELGKKHPSNAVIDHLAVKREGDGHWFNDSRGTNAYQDRTALITIGSPYQDIGSLAMVYSTMSGDKNAVKGNPRFDKFVQRFKESEVIQAGGRLRVHRRKGEELTWYVVTDEDISYLKSAFPGARFEQSSAFSICPEAGTQGEQTFAAICNAMKRLFDEGKKITQSAIAKTCDRIQTQGAVSKSFSNNEIIARIGGWGALRKIFQALYGSLYRGRNNFSDSWKDGLSQDQIWIVETYLPLFAEENPKDMEAIATACVEMSDIAGWRGIEAFFRRQPIDKAVEMLAWVIGLLSDDWRMQFVESAIF